MLISTNNGTKDFLWSRHLGVNLSQVSSKWINKVTVSSRDHPLTNKEPQPALGELGICLCLRWYWQGLMRKMLASHFQRSQAMKAREGLLSLNLPVFFLYDQEGLVGHECASFPMAVPEHWELGSRESYIRLRSRRADVLRGKGVRYPWCYLYFSACCTMELFLNRPSNYKAIEGQKNENSNQSCVETDLSISQGLRKATDGCHLNITRPCSGMVWVGRICHRFGFERLVNS